MIIIDHNDTADPVIRQVLDHCRTIAIVGLSPKPERDSHRVARYLQQAGYRIIPVRPGQQEILGEKAYPSLDDIDEPVDMVNLFRRPEQMPAHARQALRLTPKVFWMQLGIENQTAAALLAAAGIRVITNRCIKIEHERLCR